MPKYLSLPWSRAAGLDPLIQRLVQRWLGPPLLVALGGCQDENQDQDRQVEATSGAAGATAFGPIDCVDSHWDPMPHVRSKLTFDYRALRVRGSSLSTLSQYGVPCSTASDPTACQALLAAVPPNSSIGCAPPRCPTHVVSATRRNDVYHWTSRQEVKDFLGPIDSIEDALLLLFFDGYEIAPCTGDVVREVAGGFEARVSIRVSTCQGLQLASHLVHVSRDGSVRVQDAQVHLPGGGCPGRRPEGFDERPVHSRSEVGAFYARCAQLEEAAVWAFARMSDELTQLGAPAALIEQALAARADERRHAADMRELARRYGASAPAVDVPEWSQRAPLAIALENAVEGCVRETWAAVVATYQAARVSDATAAAVLHGIAADERRHAALSWQLGAWLDERLSSNERDQVAAARHAAITELRAEMIAPVSAELIALAGLPNEATAQALFNALQAELA